MYVDGLLALIPRGVGVVLAILGDICAQAAASAVLRARPSPCGLRNSRSQRVRLFLFWSSRQCRKPPKKQCIRCSDRSKIQVQRSVWRCSSAARRAPGIRCRSAHAARLGRGQRTPGRRGGGRVAGRLASRARPATKSTCTGTPSLQTERATAPAEEEAPLARVVVQRVREVFWANILCGTLRNNPCKIV
eukprot:gene17792-biopygen2360